MTYVAHILPQSTYVLPIVIYLTYTVPTIHSNDDIPYLSYLSYIPHMPYIWNIISTPTTPTMHTIQNIHAIHTIPTLHRKHPIPIISIQTIHTVISNRPYPTNLHTIPTTHTIPTIHAILSKHAIPDRPYTPYIPNIPYYHTPTTPQGGGQCSATHPPHHRGGGEDLIWGQYMGPIPSRGAGPGANIYIIFQIIIFPPMMFTSVSSVHPQSAQRRVEPLGAVWPLGWPRPGRWRPRPPCRQSQQSPTLRRAQSLGQRIRGLRKGVWMGWTGGCLFF